MQRGLGLRNVAIQIVGIDRGLPQPIGNCLLVGTKRSKRDAVAVCVGRAREPSGAVVGILLHGNVARINDVGQVVVVVILELRLVLGAVNNRREIAVGIVVVRQERTGRIADLGDAILSIA